MPIPALVIGALALIPELIKIAPAVVSLIEGDDDESGAQTITNIAAAVVGSTDPAMVAAAIADPEKAAQLASEISKARAAREAEKVAAEAAKEKEITARLTAELTDISNARAQFTGLAQTGSMLTLVPTMLTLAIVIMFALAVWTLSVRDSDFPPGVREALFMMIGALVTRFGQIYDFWFGSSRGSENKTDILAAVMGALPRPFGRRGGK